MKAGGVAILVLDQQMPLATGTDLFERLRAIDARVRGILLTGEATTDEVGDAMNRGFSRYVPKSQALTHLPDVIRHEYTEYQNSLLLEVAARQPVIWRRRKLWPIGATQTIRFVGFEILDDALVRGADWEEVLTLQVGHTRRETLSRSSQWSLQIEDETSSRIASEFSLQATNVAKLTSKLQGEIATRFTKTMASTVTHEQETEETFSLPAEPAEVGQLHVRARRVQQAPVLVSTRVQLVEDCNSCRYPHLLSVQLLVHTGTLALRHVDQYSDGTEVTVPLGRAGAA